MKFQTFLGIMLLIIRLELTACAQFHCTNNDACQSVLALRCETTTLTCIRPSLTTDCMEISPYGVVVQIGSPISMNICTKSCLTHSDCFGLPTAKICSPSSSTCVECLDSTDCSAMGFIGHECNSGFCQYDQTQSNPCGPTSPYCNDMTGLGCFDDTLKCWPTCSTMISCSSTSECIEGALDMVTGVCSKFSHLPPSISCTSNEDCMHVELAQCSLGVCTPCSSDSHCSHIWANRFCEGGTCRLCKPSDNSGCYSPYSSRCDASIYQCLPCFADSDCSNFPLTPFCDSDACRECRPSDNTGCTDLSAPRCSDISYKCDICQTDADCSRFTSTPYCEQGSCRACKTIDNSGCTSPTASKCIAPLYTCIACSTDSDCSQFSNTPYCEAGVCVSCKTNSNIGCNDPLNPTCLSQQPYGNICGPNPGLSSSCPNPTSYPPHGGSLIVTPVSGGTPLSTSYTAILDGWLSYNGIIAYTLEYVKTSPLLSDPVRISEFSTDTQINFYLPYTSIATIRATIKDEFDCLTNTTVDVTLSLASPNGTDLLQSAISFLSMTSLGDASTAATNALIDQFHIANQLLLCNNDLDTSACDTIQAMSCGASSACSNHGQCAQGRCICNQGYYLSDCSLSQSNYDLQMQLRQSLISSAITSMNAENLPEMMSIINSLTEKPYLNTNSTLNPTLDAVSQAIQILNSYTTSANLSAEIQAISDLISNGFDQITQLDCGLYNEASIRALNQSYEFLQQLSDVFVKSSESTPGALLNISTNAFLMYLGVYSLSQLNNLQLSVSDNAPQIQINSLQNQASLPNSIALAYTYLKKDPLKCDSSPATNFTLDFKDAKSLQPIHPNASILITYPQKTFGEVTCLIQCRRAYDADGNPTCFCKDISIFDVKSQLGRLYSQSNLRLLTLSNISKIFTTAIFFQWSFWTVVVTLLWFIVTLIVVKTCNKDYCLAKKVRRDKQKSGSSNGIEKFFMYFAVVHPLLGIYFYKGTYATTKAFRALIYFVRVMSLLGTSAIFMKNPDPDSGITEVILI